MEGKTIMLTIVMLQNMLMDITYNMHITKMKYKIKPNNQNNENNIKTISKK